LLSSENWKNKVNKRMQLIRALHPEFQKTIFIKGTEVIHPEFGGVKGF